MCTGKIHFEGRQGTCWLIAPTRVITAGHCVGPTGSDVIVNLNGIEVPGVVLDCDQALDAAVVEIPQVADLTPLLVCTRPNNTTEAEWNAFGYPGVLDGLVHGLTLGGRIRNFRAGRNDDGDALQLQCDEGGLPHLDHHDEIGDPAQVFSGMSGAAVRVGGDGGPVVGLWLQSPTVLHGVAILVSPMESIVDRFRESLTGVQIRPWDEQPFLDIRLLENGTCRIAAHPFLKDIASAWNVGSGRLKIACDVPRGAAPALQTALLRLIVHAPNITALEFSSHADWQTAAVQAAKSGMPLDNFVAATVVNLLPWSALTASVPPLAMTTERTMEDVARAIHESCDRWILAKLASKIDSVLAEEHTQDLIRFQIAEDLREPMGELWNSWKLMLARDAAILRNFLTLMLTENGEFDVTKRALIAVGPRTLDICLVRLLAYTLAVNCCLPNRLQLSAACPGNLMNTDHAGHACGIEIYKSSRLHLRIGEHSWSTPIVFIPHLDQEFDILMASTRPLSEPSGVTSAVLSSTLPRTLLFTGSKELLDAMAANRATLTSLLHRKGEIFYALQKNYIPQT